MLLAKLFFSPIDEKRSTRRYTVYVPNTFDRIQLDTPLRNTGSSLMESLEHIFNRMAVPLFRYARSLVRNRQEAEEVVQDVFCRLLKSRPAQLTDAYIYKAVRNRSLDSIRRGKRDRSTLEIVPAGQLALDQSLVIREVLDELPADQREVLVLKVFCGLTMSEIANIQGTPSNTCSSRYRYALQHMSKLVASSSRPECEEVELS